MWLGKDVSLREFSEITEGAWVEAPYSKPGYNWIKQREMEAENRYGLAHLRDINVFDIFNIFSKSYGLFCTSVSYPGSLNNYRVPHHYDGDVLSLESEKREVSIPGHVVLVGGSGNHYHWLLNWLPRYWVWKRLAEQLGAPRQVKFAVHFGISQQHKALLHLLGIADDQILIMRPDVYTYRVENLYVPTFFSSHCYYIEVMRFLNRLGDRFGKEEIPGIYISRRKLPTPRRRVINEVEIEPILSRFGIQAVELESLGILDQIRLFRSSWAIIGPHGAGLANLAFARRGADCLLFEYKKVSEFAELAMLCDVRCESRITAQVANPDHEEKQGSQTRNRDFIVDPDTVEQFLSSIALRRHW